MDGVERCGHRWRPGGTALELVCTRGVDHPEAFHKDDFGNYWFTPPEERL